MKPYFQNDEAGITLYHGDCLHILPHLEHHDAVITDPVWPNAPDGMFPVDDPQDLLSNALYRVTSDRIVICLRNDSDPRFLEAVPIKYPFLQAMWLRYACVGHMNRFLTGNEVAYGFGKYVKRETGRISIPAMAPVAQSVPRDGHPCPRSESHIDWLVYYWSEHSVLDPFNGSGTTGVACIRLGRQYTGIHIP